MGKSRKTAKQNTERDKKNAKGKNLDAAVSEKPICVEDKRSNFVNNVLIPWNPVSLVFNAIVNTPRRPISTYLFKVMRKVFVAFLISYLPGLFCTTLLVLSYRFIVTHRDPSTYAHTCELASTCQDPLLTPTLPTVEATYETIVTLTSESISTSEAKVEDFLEFLSRRVDGVEKRLDRVEGEVEKYEAEKSEEASVEVQEKYLGYA